MKILVLGANGMLGTEVVAELEGHGQIIQRDMHDCDITDEECVASEVREGKPDIVINCAAFTNVDGCETNKDTAFSVNAEGVKNVARACKNTGCSLYHISTDFVFDGTKRSPYSESDNPNPVSVYAHSKYMAEQYVKETAEKYVIIRTAWLFGKKGKNFVSTIRSLAMEKRRLTVVHDQIGSPTYAIDLAKAINALIQKKAQGIYHVTNSGMCSWYEFAKEIVYRCGADTEVVPVTSDEYPRPAKRPAYSVLDCAKFENYTGMRLRRWQDALDAYLEEIRETEERG